MAIRCTIRAANVVNEYGQTLAVGTIYTPVNDDYALSLISQGKATDTDDYLGERVNAPFDEVVYPVTPAGYSLDASGNVTGLVGPDGDEVSTLVYSVQQSSQDCFRTGASVVGWALTNIGGATATMAMDLASPLGGPALKVTFPNDTGTVDLDATGIEVPNFTSGRGKVVVHAYVQNELEIKQIRVYAGTTSLTRNMDRTYSLSNSNVFRANGDHIIPVHPDNAAANTLLTTDTLDTVRLRMNAQSGGGAVWIGGVYIPDPEPEQWMVVTFDDADISLYSRLYPLMADRGLKWTLGLNWNDVGTNDALYVNFNQLAAMYAAGIDIASHNRTNTAYPDENPPTAQPNDAARLTYCTEYRYCRGQLLNLGYTRASGYHPFVQGAFDGALCDAVHAHGGRLFRSASTETNVEPFMLDKQIVVSQRKLGSAASLATAKTWVDQANTRAQDVLLMGHVLAASASSTITWAQTDFEALVDYALAQGLRVGSVSQWAQARGFVV